MMAFSYVNTETETGYPRDRTVFGKPITIEDTMGVTARYRNDVAFKRASSHIDGAASALVGSAGNQSMLCKQMVAIDD